MCVCVALVPSLSLSRDESKLETRTHAHNVDELPRLQEQNVIIASLIVTPRIDRGSCCRSGIVVYGMAIRMEEFERGGGFE